MYTYIYSVSVTTTRIWCSVLQCDTVCCSVACSVSHACLETVSPEHTCDLQTTMTAQTHIAMCCSMYSVSQCNTVCCSVTCKSPELLPENAKSFKKKNIWRFMGFASTKRHKSVIQTISLC